jgi:hypothetical protein
MRSVSARVRPDDDQTNKKGIATMKLTTTTFVSVDGVMQGIGGPDEDRSGGFERGGWTTPLWDNEAGTLLNQVYQRADAFLFGRRTDEIFAGSWGVVDDPSINPIATDTHPLGPPIIPPTRAPHRPVCNRTRRRVPHHPGRGRPSC